MKRKIDSYKSNIVEKAKKYSVLIVKLSTLLPKNPAGYSIAGQLVRSSTSVGANLVEAQEAVSKKDFIHKLTISLKEIKESRYWLEIIVKSGLLRKSEVDVVLQESEEIVKILVSSLKKLRNKAH
jgi:four helix bundle protein